jgi:hypothetical protein
MKRHRATSRDFESEAHLCEVFAERARAAGLEVYPEVEEWDLLLVVPGSLSLQTSRPVQVGVEAKLRPTLEVVAQAYHRSRRPRRPDSAAVLVPHVPQALAAVCSGLNLACWSPVAFHADMARFLPALPGFRSGALEIPRYDVPHLRAGAPSPRPLTKWREAAIRLCLRLRERGWVTVTDFKELGLARRWWTGPGGCLAPDGYEGRFARYVARPGSELPDKGWEAVAEQIRAEERRRGAA